MFNGTYPVSRFLTDQSGNIYISTSGAFGSGSLTTKVTIATGGNVGIGTTSPASLLHVFTGAPDFGVGAIIQHDTSSAGRFATLSFGAGSYRKAAIAIESSGDTNGTGHLVFAVDSNNDAANVASGDEKMRIQSDGNVGIGTTSPSNILHIKNADPVIRLEDSSPDGVYGLIDAAGGDFIISADGGAGSADSFISFRVDGTAVGSEKMRITSGGNVGIGTTSPDALLHLESSSTSACILRLESTATDGYPSVRFFNDAAEWRIYGADGSQSDSFVIYGGLNGSLNSRLVVNTDGKVGIGVTDPGSQLDVKGDISVRDTDSSSNHVYLFSNSAEGVLRLSNGANYGFIARGQGNNPFIGTHTSGNLNISGFTNSLGASIGFTLAQFNFSTQRVGIGLQSPYGKLEVAISPTTSSTTVNETADFADKFVISNSGTSANGNRIPLVFNIGGSGADNISAAIVGERESTGWNSALSFWVNNVTSGAEGTDAIQEGMRLNSDGNLGIGTTSPTDAKLQVAGGDIRIDQYALKVYQSTSNNFGDGVRVYYDNANTAFVHRFLNTTSIVEIWGDGGNNAGIYMLSSAAGGGTLNVRDNSGNYTLSANSALGNVGIGTNTPSYKLEVNGDFAATSKSFIIDHPTKPNKKLRYGSLEGPENGVYVRGRGDSNVIKLPDYWVGLVHDDSITVQITAIGKDSEGKVRTYSVNDIVDNKVYIYTDSKDEVYNYFYIVNGERKDIDKLEVEIDK
jgi:hypothetical protein